MKQIDKDELRKEWIERLRSGKYLQGRQLLHQRIGDQHQYCCLGVLCDILHERGVLQQCVDEYVYEYYLQSEENECAILPEGVSELVGLFDRDGSCRISGRMSLVELNDREVPFSKIANYLDSGDFWD